MKLHFCQAFIETYSVVIRFSSDKEDNCEKKEKTASFRAVSVCHFNFYRFLPSKSISMNNGRYFLRLYKHRFCLFISVFLFIFAMNHKLISKLDIFLLILANFFFFSPVSIRFWYDVVLFLLPCRVLCNISLWQILVTGLRFYLPYYEHLEKMYNRLGCAHTITQRAIFSFRCCITMWKDISLVNVICKREYRI